MAVEAPADTKAAGDGLFDTAAEPPEQTASAGNAERAETGDVAGADAGVADEAPSAAAETAAPAATEAAADAAQVAAAPTPLAVMKTPEDLAAVAADAKAAVENDPNRDVLARPCNDEAFDDIDTYVAIGTYRDRSVLIGIDDDDDRAFAVDPDTCEIVAEAPLP